MNGIKQNSVAQTNVVVSSIKNGGYSVKLIFEDGKKVFNSPKSLNILANANYSR